MIRRSILALVLLLAGAFDILPAQSRTSGVTVFGKVVDARSSQPIPFLTVQLRTERDSAFLTGRLTDSTGAFTFRDLASGVYRLEARRIGYEPLVQRVLVGELSAFLDLGVLPMVPAAAQLGGVVVSASADEVSAAMDRRTFRVADNVSQSGGSVLQAMASLPGVTVSQDGKVQLRGSDQVIVLIDGKQTALTGFGAQSGLANLPASAIENIEIITNPGARFDANGSAGVINLILKKEEQDGLNGSLGLTAGAGALWEKRANLPSVGEQYRVTPKINPSVSLNYRKGGTNTFLRGDWLHSPTLNKNEFATRQYGDTLTVIQQMRRNRDTDYATVSAGVDHAFDEYRSLTVSTLYNQETIIDHGDNPYFRNDVATRYRLWQFLEDEVLYAAYGTAVYTRRYPQPGRSLTVTGIVSFHREDEKYFFTNTLAGFTGRDSFALIADEHVQDLNVDYIRPLRQGRVEAGFKGRRRVIPTNMQFFPGPQSPIDSGAGGRAEYRELIPALYGNYVYESETVELEGGLRVETVILDYDVNPDHNTYRSDGYRYTQPFPNVRVAYKFSPSRKLSLFVNRRVDRPNEGDIRIFPKYDEPELLKVGNPGLQPQFTTSADLGYRASWGRGSLYGAAFHRITDATITRIATSVPGDSILYNVTQNAGRSWMTGAELVWQQSLTDWITTSTNAMVYRSTVGAFTVLNQYPQPTSFSAPRQEIVSGNFKVNATILAPGGWDARVTSVYLAPDLLPQGRIESRYSLDVGLRKSVQGGRGEVIVNATDVLNTMQLRRTIRGTDFTWRSTDYLETQAIRVGYSWKF
ncbi:MAG: TonB-dependent receptor [Gemmatimonadaceae bacterium]|nr:TonB-dependent receptor [Gemmatimonadaceae bacterium]